MLKIKGKKLVALLTLCATLVSMVAFPCISFAETGITKDETVYVITNDQGQTSDVIVSDHLINNTNAKVINDKSDLLNIKNVKGDEKFTQKGEKIVWQADKHDIFYQGRSSNPIPVKMAVSYYMNGKKLSGDAMQGKKGKFEIKINYSINPNSEANGIPFVVLSGMLFKDDNYSKVKVDHGKAVDDGDKTIVVGMAAPGLSEGLGKDLSSIVQNIGLGNSVTISGHAKTFDATDIMSIAMCSLFDGASMGSLGSLGGLDFDSQINQLDSGAKKLVNATNALYGGISKLHKEAPKLKKGVKQLADGSEELYNGLKEVKKGVVQLQEGQAQMTDGLTQMDEGVQQIGPAFDLMTDGLDQLSSGIDTMVTLSNTSLTAANLAALKMAAKLKSIQGSRIKIEAFEAMFGRGSYTQMKAYADEILLAVTTAKKINSSSPSALLERGGVKQTVSSACSELKNGISQLKSGTNQLIGGLEGTSQSPGLLGGAKQISEGMATLSDGLGEINSKDGSTLIGGASQLAAGLSELNDSTNELINGINQLNTGSKAIANGMGKLYNTGIKKIVDLYNNGLKSLTGGLKGKLGAGNDYKTFTRLGDGMNGNVKFIFKTVISE